MKHRTLHLPAVRGIVKIRHLRESDLQEWYELERDKDLKRFICGTCLEMTLEDWAAQARLNFDSDTTLALEHVPSGVFAGRASIAHFSRTWNHEHRELQVVVRREFLGQGIGKDACILLCALAFASLGATSVFATVHPAHPRSLQLLAELGFSEVNPNRTPEGNLECRVFELTDEMHGTQP